MGLVSRNWRVNNRLSIEAYGVRSGVDDGKAAVALLAYFTVVGNSSIVSEMANIVNICYDDTLETSALQSVSSYSSPSSRMAAVTSISPAPSAYRVLTTSYCPSENAEWCGM